MTIKQQGGIFGRNPSFNDVDANSLNVDGTITSDGLTVDGTTSLEDVTVSLDDTTSADSMPALTPSGSELVVKNTNNSADYTGIRLTTRTSAAGSWVIANEFAGSYKGDLVFHARDGASSSADKITFTNAGSIKINTSGQGIDFSATSGTGTSELFDDYEEGSFSPELLFGGSNTGMTYTNQDGVYTKVGNVVHFQIYIRLSAKGTSTGNTSITGLPFSTNFGYNIPAIWWTNMGTGLQPFSFATNGSTTLIIQANVSGSSQNITNTSFTDTSRIALSATFRV